MPAITVIKLRRDTAANWASTNPVLAAGEAGLETDTDLVKYGDGTSTWTELQYPATSRVSQLAKNDTGASVTKGQVVYVSGANGSNALFSLADADTEATSSKTVGLLAQDLATNGIGSIITEGLLTGIDTSAATVGQSVWLSNTAGGRVYGAPPAKPAHGVYLGVVTRAHANQGSILVKVQNGYELNELHDVNAGSPSTGDALVWNGTAWVNQQVDVSGAISTHNSDTTNVHGIADTSLLATKAYADNAAATAAAAIVDAAPGTLDTLNELAAAINDDASFAATVTTALGNKQDKVANVTDTEIGYLDGVTSAIQTQIDGKVSNLSPTVNDSLAIFLQNGFTNDTAFKIHTMDNGVDTLSFEVKANGYVYTPSLTVGNVQNSEIQRLTGVTSNIQTQIDGKAASTHTHAQSDITGLSTALTAKQDKVTGVSDTEIGYLANVTSDIQEQIDAAGASAATPTTLGTVYGNTTDVNWLGRYSTALGSNSLATDGAIAIGDSAQANNLGVAMGRSANASGTGIAIGDLATASYYSTAIGSGTAALGDNSTVIGTNSQSSGNNQIVIGSNISGSAAPFDGTITIGNSSNTTLAIPGVGLRTDFANNGQYLTWSSNSSVTGGPGFEWAYLNTPSATPSTKGAVDGLTRDINGNVVFGYNPDMDTDYIGSQNVLIGESLYAANYGAISASVVVGNNAGAIIGSEAVAVGFQANAQNNSVAIGYGADAYDGNATAVGTGAYANSWGIAVGAGAAAYGPGAIVIGTSMQTSLKIPGIGIDTTTAANGQGLIWNSAGGNAGTGAFEWQTLGAPAWRGTFVYETAAAYKAGDVVSFDAGDGTAQLWMCVSDYSYDGAGNDTPHQSASTHWKLITNPFVANLAGINEGDTLAWSAEAQAFGPVAAGGPASTEISANATLEPGKYFVTASSKTLTLPASPSLGDEIKIFDSTSTGAFTTINRNGNKINGVADNYYLNVAGFAVTLTWTGATNGWRLV